jgi:hypothetical protein
MTDVTPHPRPPSSKKRKRLTNAEKEAREIFKKCGVPFGYEAHHILYQQELRKHGHSDLLWDLRNRLVVEYRKHERHHSGAEPIKMSELSLENVQFAEELGLYWLLVKHYPE